MYLNDIARAIRDEVPEDELPEGTTLALFRLYAVLLLAKGADITGEDVHNAWVAWMASQDADHDALMPFSELDAETQAQDSPFVAAIRAVAIRCGR